MPSFTEINTVFQAIIEFLQEFIAKVAEMFEGISYGFVGYKPEEATTEENLPL